MARSCEPVNRGLQQWLGSRTLRCHHSRQPLDIGPGLQDRRRRQFPFALNHAVDAALAVVQDFLWTNETLWPPTKTKAIGAKRLVTLVSLPSQGS